MSVVYNDTDFTHRAAVAENVVPALQGTDLHVITALSPAGLDDTTNQLIMLGPNAQDAKVYSHSIGAVYSVLAGSSSTDQNSASPWSYIVEASEMPFSTHPYTLPLQYEESDWTDYFLPVPVPVNSSLLTEITQLTPVVAPTDSNSSSSESATATFRDPYAGSPATVTQIASASTALFNYLSIRAYPTLAMLASISLDLVVAELEQSDFIKNILRSALIAMYVTTTSDPPIFKDMSVCTQWPKPCGSQDGAFIDGGKNEALVLRVHYLLCRIPFFL